MRKLPIITSLIIMTSFLGGASAKVGRITTTYLPDPTVAGNVMELAALDAQKKLIAREIGQFVSESFSMYQSETNKNGESDFYSNISNRLESHIEGYVKSANVISQKWITENNMQVIQTELEADVYDSELKSKVNQLAALYAKAGNVLLLLQEVVVDEKGRRNVVKNNTIINKYAQSLKNMHFNLVAAPKANKISGLSEDAFDNLVTNNEDLLDLCKEAGADIVIYGRVEISSEKREASSTFSALSQTEFKMQANLNVIQASTGEVLASSSPTVTIPTNKLANARARAFKDGDENNQTMLYKMVAITDELGEALALREEQGIPYVVILQNVSDQLTVGKKFEAIIDKLVDGKEYKGVANTSYDKDNAQLTITLMSRQNQANKVVDKINQTCQGEALFSNIKLVSSQGYKIIFSL